MIKKIVILLLSITVPAIYFYYSGKQKEIMPFNDIFDKQPLVGFQEPYELSYTHFDRAYDCDETISSYNQLIKNTDYIVLVEVLSRKQLSNTFETTVKIHQTIKGNLKDSIVVYEPIAYQRDTNIISIDGYLPWMKNNQIYLVFLNESMVEGYYHFTSSLFGCFPIKNQLSCQTYDYCTKEGELTFLDYQSVLNNDVIEFDFKNYLSLTSNDQELIDKINNYQNQIYKYKQTQQLIMNHIESIKEGNYIFD